MDDGIEGEPLRGGMEGVEVDLLNNIGDIGEALGNAVGVASIDWVTAVENRKVYTLYTVRTNV